MKIVIYEILVRYLMQESRILHEFFVVKGKMARYLSYKGYGFISVEGKDKDVFFHTSKFPSNRLPVQGQDLEFKLVETPRGPEAQDIRVLDLDAGAGSLI